MRQLNEHVVKVSLDDKKKWWVFEIPSLTSASPKGAGREIVAIGQAKSITAIKTEAVDIIEMWSGETNAKVRLEFYDVC